MILPPVDVLNFWPDYRSADLRWQALAPVAKWVVAAANPAVIVDLATGRGDSFLAFAQAAADAPQLSRCCGVFAPRRRAKATDVDATRTAVLQALDRRGDPRMQVLRVTGAKAAAEFAMGSVDVLHLGETPDAASLRRNLDLWLPRMAEGGIVMLHGTQGSARGLWREIALAHPARCLELAHSGGMGLWCLGEAVRHDLHDLCAARDGVADIAAQALRLSGDRITGLAAFERSLLAAAGVPVPHDHLFAQGEARARLLALFDLQRAAGKAVKEIPLTKADWTQASARIDTAVAAQLAAARKHVLAGLLPVLRREIAGAYPQIEPLVRQTVKHKNDVQDDAIMGIGAKVDAQDAAILGLTAHVRDILGHPLFRR